MSRLMVHFVGVVADAAITATAVAGCAGGNDTGTKAPDEATTAVPTTAATEAPGDEASGGEPTTTEGDAKADPEENGAAQAGIDLDNPPEPIGEVTMPVNAKGISKVKVEVLELRKRDNVLLATFRFTPEGSTSEDVSIFKLLGNHSFRPELVDLKNLKKYGHVEELTGDVTAARSEVVESLYAFTAFPIPPADVTTIDMRVSDQAPLIEGLTLP